MDDAGGETIVAVASPPGPAERLSQMPEAGAQKVAAARSVDLRTLKRTLAGDLKWVVGRNNHSTSKSSRRTVTINQ